jgi:hypothetical protein
VKVEEGESTADYHVVAIVVCSDLGGVSQHWFTVKDDGAVSHHFHPTVATRSTYPKKFAARLAALKNAVHSRSFLIQEPTPCAAPARSIAVASDELRLFRALLCIR